MIKVKVVESDWVGGKARRGEGVLEKGKEVVRGREIWMRREGQTVRRWTISLSNNLTSGGSTMPLYGIVLPPPKI